jgi:hypothetical protein
MLPFAWERLIRISARPDCQALQSNLDARTSLARASQEEGGLLPGEWQPFLQAPSLAVGPAHELVGVLHVGELERRGIPEEPEAG